MMKLVGLNASTIADKEIKKDAVIGCEEQNKIHVLPNLYEFVVEKEQLQQVQPQPKEEEKKNVRESKKRKIEDENPSSDEEILPKKEQKKEILNIDDDFNLSPPPKIKNVLKEEEEEFVHEGKVLDFEELKKWKGGNKNSVDRLCEDFVKLKKLCASSGLFYDGRYGPKSCFVVRFSLETNFLEKYEAKIWGIIPKKKSCYSA